MHLCTERLMHLCTDGAPPLPRGQTCGRQLREPPALGAPEIAGCAVCGVGPLIPVVTVHPTERGGAKGKASGSGEEVECQNKEKCRHGKCRLVGAYFFVLRLK